MRQKAHFIAQPTWVEMQKVCDGVSGMKTDSMRWPSASSRRNLVVPSVDRSCLATAGVPTDMWLGEPGAQLTAEVGHRLEVGHAAAIDPAEDLAPVKAGHTRRREMLFDLVELELGRVDANGGGHGAAPALRWIHHSTMRDSGAFSARFCLELHGSAHGNIPFWLIAANSFQIKHLLSPD